MPLYVFLDRQQQRFRSFLNNALRAARPYVRRGHSYLRSTLRNRSLPWNHARALPKPEGGWPAISPAMPSQPDFMETLLQRSLPPNLHALLQLRAAMRMSCEHTVAQRTQQCLSLGWTAELVEATRNGARHPGFSEREDLLLKYADDITRTPIDVDLQLFRKLRQRFTQEQIAEATSVICYENFRTRYHNAMGVEAAQAYKEFARHMEAS